MGFATALPQTMPRSSLRSSTSLKDGRSPTSGPLTTSSAFANEVLYAQAYAKRFHKELKQWATKWAEPFKQVDYAKLMEVSQ